MKRILLTLFALASCIYGNAQANKDWMQMMHDTSYTFYDVQKAFYQWYATQPEADNKTRDNEEESGAYVYFKRWEYLNAPRVYPTGKLPAIGFNDLQKVSNTPAAINNSATQRMHRVQTNTWQLLGPSTIPPISSGYDSTNTSGWSGGDAGRLNVIKYNPLKTTTIYAGAASGGLWRSYDAGHTWTPIGDNLASMGITDIQFVPNDTNTIYLATGDLDGNDIPSVGLLKSTDNGQTWHQTGLTFTLSQHVYLGNIVIDPVTPTTLYVATSAGLKKSTDSAHTWTTLHVGNNYVMNIAMNPGNDSLIYATTFMGKYYYSNNGGQTWNNQPASLPAAGIFRESIGVTPANPTYVYLLAANYPYGGFEGIYLSTDSGKTFTAQFTEAANQVDLLDWTQNGSGTSGQGWYTLTIAVNPLNAQQVFVGGVNLWESNNSGTSWTCVSNWADSSISPNYVHADIHRLVYLPDTSAVLVANDGGIFEGKPSGWSNLSSGLSVGQIYKIGASAHTSDLVLSGWQDNGGNEDNGPGSSWQEVFGSDGAACIIDWSDDNYQYGSFTEGWFLLSTDKGNSFNTIPTTSINEQPSWITPLVEDPANSQTLYAGFTNIWKGPNRGSSWSSLAALPAGSGTHVVDIRIAPSNNQYIYTTNGTQVFVTTNGGTSWTDISTGLPSSTDYCNELCVCPTNPSLVWAVFSGYDTKRVFYSSNAGSTWTNISSGLPQYPINCIAYENGTNGSLYVGTDVGGIYYKDNTMTNWIPYSTGLPNVRISDFQMDYNANQIIAATYGRSIWKCNFYVNPTSVNSVTAEENGVTVYPNPSNGTITFKSSVVSGKSSVIIYNMLGEKIYSEQLTSYNSQFTIDLSNQPGGMYFYQLYDSANNPVAEGKFSIVR